MHHTDLLGHKIKMMQCVYVDIEMELVNNRQLQEQ